MGTHEDMSLVYEAANFAHDPKQWPWFPSKKLAELLKHVCAAYYRLRFSGRQDEELTARSERIAIEQKLACILTKHCEDKSSPPYRMVDGAFDIGVKSAIRLAEEVEARIDEIVRFRAVMARKHLEDRDEYEQKLGHASSLIEEIEKSRREIRDELTEAKEAIRAKDAALLAAAERISGQSEALTNAARKKPWRRACESIHEPYSGKCEHCMPPDHDDDDEGDTQAN